MKRFLLACAALVLVSGIAPAPAEAQFCFDFTAFCDGLTLLPVPGTNNVTGTWENWDCAGSQDPSLKGRRNGNFSNPCGGTVPGKVGCHATQGCVVGGAGNNNWTFSFDGPPLDGTLDMGRGPHPTDTCWIDEVAYVVVMGTCPFKPDKAVSSIGNIRPE